MRLKYFLKKLSLKSKTSVAVKWNIMLRNTLHLFLYLIVGIIALVLPILVCKPVLATDVRINAVTDSRTVLLYWSNESKYPAYNIYRRELTETKYKKLNSTAIKMLTNCKAIKQIIHPDSVEWSLISHAADTSPCFLSKVSTTDTSKWQVLSMLGVSNYKIGLVLGQAYFDSSAVNSKRYVYTIQGVTSDGRKSEYLDSVLITAGVFSLLAAPTGVQGVKGDCKAQILWNEVNDAIGYHILRRRTPSGVLRRISEGTIALVCSVTIADDTLPSPKLCFTDVMCWDTMGYPTSHDVAGHSISGPFNDSIYYYRIKAIDILGRAGQASSQISVKPMDTTPPQAPTSVTVEAKGDTLVVSWQRVVFDKYRRIELGGIKGYAIYRADSMADTLGTTLSLTVAQPTDTLLSVIYKDASSIIKPAYGEKMFFYKMRAIDKAGNVSVLSSPVSGFIPDTTPPNPPIDLKAEGYGNYIELNWNKNTEPDMGGYEIYRGECHGDTVIDKQGERKIYVPYPLYVLATIDDPDSIVYWDTNVPEGKPTCFKYAVKAFDKKQNLSDTSNTVCEKIREDVGPPAPIIVDLKARDKAILIEWVSPPVQDLFDFIVERTVDTVNWIQVNEELTFPTYVGCDDIPPINNWAADSVFSFLDTSVTAKKLYLYRVKGADFHGNIGDPSVYQATFTYDYSNKYKPVIKVKRNSFNPYLNITWTPAYEATLAGFIVFRRAKPDVKFSQISPLIKGNAFVDKKVRRGVIYEYVVQSILTNGNRSEPSKQKTGSIP